VNDARFGIVRWFAVLSGQLILGVLRGLTIGKRSAITLALSLSGTMDDTRGGMARYRVGLM